VKEEHHMSYETSRPTRYLPTRQA